MIVVKPFGGLCNRLRVIDSARTLARQVGTGVQIIWTTGPDMVAEFQDLFEAAPDLAFRSEGRFRLVRSPSQAVPLLGALCRAINRSVGVTAAFSERDMPRVWNGELDLSRLATGGDALFCTCQSFTNWQTLDFSWVTPVAAIRREIESVAIDERTVGVHIRRTDHDEAIRESPLDLFLTRLEERQRRAPDTRFFVATDDPEAERRLVARFGPASITTYPKRFGRDSVQAIKDAVVDLFSLARTREIVASVSSSFSQTAAVMGRVPIDFVRK